MKNKSITLRKILSSVLAVIIIIAGSFSGLMPALTGSAPIYVSAEEASDDYSVTKSVLLKTSMGTYGTAGYYSTQFYTQLTFDDRWLTTADLSQYNYGLAKFSVILSSFIYDGVSCMIDGPEFSYDKSEMLRAFGFDDAQLFSISNSEETDNITTPEGTDNSENITFTTDSDDGTTIIIGHRYTKIDSAPYDIYVVVIRGSTGAAEWQSNFDVGCDSPEYIEKTGEHPEWTERDNHKGFDVVANRVRDLLDSYAAQHKNNGATPTFLITGHSRGAGIANILGSKLENAGISSCAYTYASPCTTTAPDKYASTTVFNIINSNDFVTALPLKELGFSHYGTNIIMDVANTPEACKIVSDSLGAEYFGKDPSFLVDNFSELATSREDLYVDDVCICTYDTEAEKNTAFKATADAIKYLNLGEFISVENADAPDENGHYYFKETLCAGALMAGISRIMAVRADYTEMFAMITHLSNVYPKDSKYSEALSGYLTSITSNLIESFYPHMTTCYYAIVEALHEIDPYYGISEENLPAPEDTAADSDSPTESATDSDSQSASGEETPGESGFIRYLPIMIAIPFTCIIAAFSLFLLKKQRDKQ